MPPARVHGCSITRPVIIGNTTQNLGDKKVGEHTHKWTISVKGVDGEDIGVWIKKVIFKLHDTYENPSRTVTKPPFEVHETGWGEFDIMIRIYFAPESYEKSVMCYHHLKLHPYGADIAANQSAMEPISSWQYEEIVFQEPTEAMYDLLTRHPIGSGRGIPNHATRSNPYSLQAEQDECERLDEALRKVENTSRELVTKLKDFDAEFDTKNIISTVKKTSKVAR